MSFVLESGCKSIAFWLTNQIFSQKSCLKTYLFNTCLQLARIKLLIYLIKYTHAGAWVCAYTYTQITCMAGDAVPGTRILSFRTRIFIFSNTNLIFEHEFYFFEHESNELNESWCLRNINLARIKRNLMNSTGTRNFLRGSHTDLIDLTDFLNAREEWRDEKIVVMLETELSHGYYGKQSQASVATLDFIACQSKKATLAWDRCP